MEKPFWSDRNRIVLASWAMTTFVSSVGRPLARPTTTSRSARAPPISRDPFLWREVVEVSWPNTLEVSIPRVDHKNRRDGMHGWVCWPAATNLRIRSSPDTAPTLSPLFAKIPLCQTKQLPWCPEWRRRAAPKAARTAGGNGFLTVTLPVHFFVV